MGALWLAVLFGTFVWWFSTGAILLAVSQAARRGWRAALLVISAPLLVFGAWGAVSSLDDASAGGARLGFLAAIALWGWFEIAFLSGVVTGPNRRVCPDGVPEWERFLRAWGTVGYVLTALAVIAVALWMGSLGAANRMAAFSFAVLLLARISAKLNLYLGVPNIHTDFLPPVLSHLPSHFRNARMNWLFPVSVTGLTAAAALFGAEAVHALSAGREGAAVGMVLLSTLSALAALEHWGMVAPLGEDRLWRFLIPQNKQAHQVPTLDRREPRHEF